MKEVSVDMWGGFPKVINKVFPNALIVIDRGGCFWARSISNHGVDRFHVMKIVNKALNKLRLSLELKGLKNRCLLLKNSRDLTYEEQPELLLLLQKSPCLSIADELKEEFRDIYETSTTVKMGRRRFKKWLIAASCIFGSITQTILKHKRGNL